MTTIMKKHVLTATALAAVLSMAVATAATADEAKTEKCYGVAKVGKNDCKTDAHACAGKSTADSKGDFVSLPVGLCDKLMGGSTEAPKTAEAPKDDKKDGK
jgi:uncharacterized membrane protein